MLRTSSWPADWLTDRASGWLSLVVGSLVSWAIVPIIILPLAGDKKVLFTLFHLLHSGPYKSMSATKHSLWKRISNGKFDFFFFFVSFPTSQAWEFEGNKQPCQAALTVIFKKAYVGMEVWGRGNTYEQRYLWLLPKALQEEKKLIESWVSI